MFYTVYKQLPKPKKIGIGTISITNGDAHCFGEVFLIDKLARIKLEWMAVKGFMISGFEDVGVDKHGMTKYRYQEWFCEYCESKE